MNPFKLALKKKSPEEKLALGATHITCMEGNEFFPEDTRVPSDAQVQQAQDELAATAAEVDALRTQLEAKLQELAVKEAAWERVISARADYCAAVAPKNPPAQASTGLPLRASRSPVGALPAPGNVRARMGRKEQEIQVLWGAVHGRRVYRLQMREHGSNAPWQDVATQTLPRFIVKGLTSGTRYSFRVLAHGPRGEGPWSDEAVCRAP